MRDFKHNRSDSYQSLLIEIAFAPDTLSDIFNYREIYDSSFNNKHDQKLDLIDQLKEAFWKLVDQLTPRQREIMILYFKERKTQTEVAKILGVNQSSVTKSINGNCDYTKKISKNNNKVRRSYGGAIKKLKKLANQDSTIQSILKELEKLQEDE